MSDLILNLKGKYFQQIKDGTKKFEYRLYNDYWKKRLVNRSYDRVIIKLGYPKKDDFNRTLVFKYNGYEIIKLKHEEFGTEEVEVFAIKLEEE